MIVSLGGWSAFAPFDVAFRTEALRARFSRVAANKKSEPVVGEDLNIVLVAGCASYQTSADASFPTEGKSCWLRGNRMRPNGALTHYLLERLSEGDGMSVPVSTVVRDVVDRLHRDRYEQTPQVDGKPSLCVLPFLYNGSK